MLKWITKGKDGSDIVNGDPRLTLENAHTYAKDNCRKCLGRGIESYDNGYEYIYEVNESGYKHPVRQRKNVRAIPCDCVLRNLRKLD